MNYTFKTSLVRLSIVHHGCLKDVSETLCACWVLIYFLEIQFQLDSKKTYVKKERMFSENKKKGKLLLIFKSE